MNEETELLETISEEEAYTEYDRFLDENYGTFQVGYSEMWASEILKNTDPISYRIGFADYIDMLAESQTLVDGWS